MRSRTLIYVVGGLAAVAIVAVALVYAFVLRRPGAPTPVAATTSTPVAAATTPVAAATPTPVSPTPKPAAAPTPTSTPAFDVVRVEPSGDMVVAGRAAPGASVELSDDGRPIGDVVADAAGEFVILPPALGPGRHPLRLSTKVGGGAPLVSDIYVAEVAGSTAVAAARPTPAAAPAVVTSSLANPPAASATPVAAAPSPTAAVAAEPTAPATPSAAVATPIVAAASPAAAVAAKPTALESPAAAVATPVAAARSPAAAATGGVVVASVRPIDPAGLEADGAAPPGVHVRLRLNGALLAEVAAGLDGAWRLTIQRGLTPGDYVLEAEVVGDAGATVARAEAPFSYPERVAEAGPVALATPQASPPAVAAEPSPTAANEPTTAPSVAATPTPTPAAATPAATNEPTTAPSVAAAPAEPSPVVTIEPTPAASVTAAPAAAPVQASPPIAPATPTPTLAAATPVATAAHAVVDVRTTTVVKGDNLWDLARHFYGDGLRYADIYTANSTQIRDPNLIYIGQIFVVPQNPKAPQTPPAK